MVLYLEKDGKDGESMCEGHDYGKAACLAVGCCHWNDEEFKEGKCFSDVGTDKCVKKEKEDDEAVEKRVLQFAAKFAGRAKNAIISVASAFATNAFFAKEATNAEKSMGAENAMHAMFAINAETAMFAGTKEEIMEEVEKNGDMDSLFKAFPDGKIPDNPHKEEDVMMDVEDDEEWEFPGW